MNKLSIIYSLNDPRTNKPFYVGATRRKLKERLTQHITANTYNKFGKRTISHIKQQLIKEIISAGYTPSIQFIFTCNNDLAGFFENQAYLFLLSKGCKLLQNQPNINYENKYTKKSVKTFGINDKSCYICIVNELIAKEFFKRVEDIKIIELLANGYITQQIEAIVYLSKRTIETRIGQIKKKMDAKTIPELITICFKEGILVIR